MTELFVIACVGILAVVTLSILGVRIVKYLCPSLKEVDKF